MPQRRIAQRHAYGWHKVCADRADLLDGFQGGKVGLRGRAPFQDRLLGAR